MTVGIVVTTYFPEGEQGFKRYQYACTTLKSWFKHFLLGNDAWRFHIADDGSKTGYDQLLHYAGELFGYSIVSGSQQHRRGVGASLNAGIEMLRSRGCDVMGYFVDDWVLEHNLDIRNEIALLRNRENIGMVRLGPPHPGLTGTVGLEPEGWFLKLNRHNFAFGFRPALYHTRFFDAYGPFDEMQSSLECERMYNERFCKGIGPDIVLSLPSPFTPTALDVVLSEIQPTGR